MPENQRREFTDLWEEFEGKATPEAQFSAALDRLEPMMQNAHTEGHAWKRHGIKKDRVIEKNRPIVLAGSQELWAYVEQMLAESADRGYFPEDRQEE